MQTWYCPFKSLPFSQCFSCVASAHGSCEEQRMEQLCVGGGGGGEKKK